MSQPTSFQIVRDYLATIFHYWWALLPGLVMPVRNIYRWFHPEHKEFDIPHWARLGSVVIALFLAQFLAYRKATLDYAVQIEANKQLLATTANQSIQIQDARREIDQLRVQRPQFVQESRNSLRRRLTRLANELDAVARQQISGLPTSEQAQAMTSEQRVASNQAFEAANKRMNAIYLDTLRSKTVGIIAEVKAKGLMTEYWEGPLEKGAEFRMPVGEEIHRLRELAYHLDAQDQVIVMSAN